MQPETYDQGYSIIEMEHSEQLLAINRELTSQVSMLLETIQRQETENMELKNRSDSLSKEVRDLKDICSRLETSLNGVLLSKSWLLTAPLRKLMGLRR